VPPATLTGPRLGPDLYDAFDATVAEARLAERGGRWVEARAHYERLLEGAFAEAKGKSAVLRWIGRTHLEEGRPEEALPIFERALDAAEAVGDVGGEAHALNWIAIAEQSTGNLDRSEELYARARIRAVRAGDDLLVAMIDQNLGTVANIRGALDLALDSYESSLRRYRALGLPHYEAHVLNNMGMLYTDLGDFANAEQAYAQAYDACRSGGDDAYARRIEVNQAELWIAKRELGRARERCEQLLAQLDAQPAAPWRGEVFKHFGVVCRESQELERADAYFARAARVAAETSDLLLAAETAREQAELYWAQSRNADTLQALNRAHAWFTRLRAERDLAAIQRRNSRLEERFLDVVRKWGESIESKDCYTQGHCVRVADLACILAQRMGFDERTLFWFRIGALLHDVGKLIVPEEVLNKPGRLDDYEWRIMRLHPEAGVELLADIEFPWDVRPMVRSHHEKWDGSGYPDGLAGDAIPLAARILTIADVYDALTTTRSYRAGFSHEKTVRIMTEDAANGHFDPSIFPLFLEWAASQQPTSD
jgi:putative nucleotidyltransferase with HDIG domain